MNVDQRKTTNGPVAAPGEDGTAAPLQNFALFEGGGLNRLLARLGLAGDAPRQVRHRILALVALAWLPPLLLAGIGNHVYGDGVRLPFLYDVGTQVRLLVALPLLILAEVEAHRRLPVLLGQFLGRGLVSAPDRSRFEASVAAAFGRRNSVWPDILTLALVMAVGVSLTQRYLPPPEADSWIAVPRQGRPELTPAGTWFVWISLPIVQFLLLRWYYRLAVWAHLLWRVSRLKLDLIPAHPDRAGGLGFLASVGFVFQMLAAAHGALLAGLLAGRLFFTDATLPQFADPVVIVVVFVQALVFAPLLFFSGQLRLARQAGLVRYATLCDRLVRDFDSKWMGQTPPSEPLVGSQDVSSMADLSGAYAMAERMRLAPITLQASLRLAAATLLPVAPLLLTIVPLNEAVRLLLGLVF